MTKDEVLNKFKVLIDKNADVSFGGYPAFLDEEIDIFLEQATVEIITNKYTGTQNQAGFEANDKRIADLQALVGTALIFACNRDTNVDNAIAFELPNDFWFYVDSYIKINGNTVYQIELTTHEIAKRFAVTYDNDPYIPVAKAVLENNHLIVYYDKHIVNTIDGMVMSYIYRPELYSSITDEEYQEKKDILKYGAALNPVLEPLIDEIINRAVLIALENIEAPRTETKAQLNSLQE